MPGRSSYGPAGKWIHDRANHILSKNDGMDKSQAYAIATQQAHKVGKSPKRFRTTEGVRTAKRKHTLPTKLYKKTASDASVQRALARLLKIAATIPAERSSTGKSYRVPFPNEPARVKAQPPKWVASPPPRVEKATPPRVEKTPPKPKSMPKRDKAKFLGAPPENTRRMPTTKGQFTGAGRRARLRGAGRRARGFARDAAEGGWRAAAVNQAGGIASQLIDRIPQKELTPSRPPGELAGAIEKATAKPKFKLSPKMMKGLRYGGLGMAGAALGVGAHQLANSVGLTEKGPADYLADAVVPTPKHASDSRYIPREYLAKAAMQMATNHDVKHKGGPEMFGPEDSVVPLRTLSTSIPISQQAEESSKEWTKSLESLFSAYKDTKGESFAKRLSKERTVPMSKQAGELAVG